MIKFLGILLLIAIAGGFLINKIPSWKQHVIEIINPAAKEVRLLGEMKSNLDELDRATKDPATKNLVSKSQSLLKNISDIHQNNSGIIKQGVSKIIDALIDRTPYPADHLSSPQNSSTPLVCPPNN